ncbi:SPASM domain peptide maturase, grasp-with-spasm system [Mucilaginibacter sp. OK268]|uniref:grasp-with-spasm system SPASM domain peptide maturase n=1 Tax=Mucilaginibacter sp. OK268 TaxID=1881048 RepID=UPI00088510AE|nr:grasp-with-spasm system SPASM domain peptide maturase [Mucilaginibacter sp. OK268]SDP99136.1 SPASM domain peptide maturase, grasp-with-spasm system [Mucilaginibacter sp. OK268]
MYFQLFADCIPVKGYNRSVICDLGRNKFNLIPNELTDFIEELKSKPFNSLLEDFCDDDKETILEYIEFLVNNEFGFFSEQNNNNSFPPLEAIFNWSGLISNSIVDVDALSSHNYERIFSELKEVNCTSVQIRFFSEQTIQNVQFILESALDRDFECIELVIEFSDELLSFFVNSEKVYPITSVQFFSCNPDKISDYIQEVNDSLIAFSFTPLKINNHEHCGLVDPSYFTSNLQLFMEGQKFNTCLNRKVSISANGEIKNCPSTTEVYGFINTTKLIDCIDRDDFKRYWTINKQSISICKDCEFRFVCTDCRAFIENPSDIYSKPLKCNYDPYSSTWLKTSNFPPFISS